MAYRYCFNCDESIEKPSAREDLVDGQVCKACGEIQRQDMTIEEWIIDLEGRLEEIEGNASLG